MTAEAPVQSATNLLLYWLSHHRQVPRYRATKAARGLVTRIECELATIGDIDDLADADCVTQATRQVSKHSRWWFRDLHRLGHVERLTDSLGTTTAWQVVPPTFLKLAEDSTLACGARTPQLMAKFSEAGFPGDVTPQPNAPDVLCIRGDADAVRDFAAESGYRCGDDRGVALLSSMKRLTAEHPALQSLPDAFLPDQKVKLYVLHDGRFRWRDYDDELVQPGVVARYGMPQRYAIYRDGRFLELPNSGRYAAQWGFVAAADDVCVRYDAHTQTLTVPASPGLPLLAERALIMASGRLPEFRHPDRVYFEVERLRAVEIVRLLNVGLVETAA